MPPSGPTAQPMIGLCAPSAFLSQTETNASFQTFDDARKTGDKTLQESIAFTCVFCLRFLPGHSLLLLFCFSDPGTTTLVFVFLLSRSGESMAIWRRKFTVPPSEQLRRQIELRRVALDAQRRGQIYEIDLK
jgi:hypothetical protein